MVIGMTSVIVGLLQLSFAGMELITLVAMAEAPVRLFSFI